MSKEKKTKEKKSLFDMTGLPQDVTNIMDVFYWEWGKYSVDQLTYLQRKDLMDGLFDIIKTNMPDFEGEITMKDVYDYNQIAQNGEQLMNPNIAACKAIYLGNMKLLRYFISQGAKDYSSLLLHAARAGRLDILKYIISQRNKTLHDIKEPGSLQRSTRMALDEATAKGNDDIVEYLTPLMQRYDRIAYFDLMTQEFEDASRGGVRPRSRVTSSLFIG